MQHNLPVFDDIIRAYKNINNRVYKTPVLTSSIINKILGLNIFFKCENLQHTGSFKFRGALNAVSELNLNKDHKNIISYSSGNHGLALAFASKIFNYKSTILMPHNAPLIKIKAAESYGGKILFYNRYSDDREKISRNLAELNNLNFISPYNNNEVIAGAGTVSKELFETIEQLDIIFVPLGGGSLLAGTAIFVKKINPKCKVYGIEPEEGNDGQISLKTGLLTKINVPETISDGAQTQQIGVKNFKIIQSHVDDIFTVSDSQIINAMRIIAEHVKMIVEPTGCMGLAYLLDNKNKYANKKVGNILSGGNIDINRFFELIKNS